MELLLRLHRNFSQKTVRHCNETIDSFRARQWRAIKSLSKLFDGLQENYDIIYVPLLGPDKRYQLIIIGKA